MSSTEWITVNHVCTQCDRLASKRCVGCRQDKYCSRGCQIATWSYHKRRCQDATERLRVDAALMESVVRTVLHFTRFMFAQAYRETMDEGPRYFVMRKLRVESLPHPDSDPFHIFPSRRGDRLDRAFGLHDVVVGYRDDFVVVIEDFEGYVVGYTVVPLQAKRDPICHLLSRPLRR